MRIFDLKSLKINTVKNLYSKATIPNQSIELDGTKVYILDKTIDVASGVNINCNGALIVKGGQDYPAFSIRRKHNVKIYNANIVGSEFSFLNDIISKDLIKDGTPPPLNGYSPDDIGILITESQEVKISNIICTGLLGNAYFLRGNYNALNTAVRNSRFLLSDCSAYHCMGGFIELATKTSLGDVTNNGGCFYGEVLNFRAFTVKIA
jgi:hypothetical protein